MNILCLTDSIEDFEKLEGDFRITLFRINQLKPSQHNWQLFESQFNKLKPLVDDIVFSLVICEYTESLPILYLLRKNNYLFPAIIIPHTNPYPLDSLSYFLLLSIYQHPNDTILCGSKNSKNTYERITGINALDICTFGINRIFQPIDKKKSRQFLGLPTNEKLVLYTGRLMDDKGISTLIESFNKFIITESNVKLVIATTYIDPFYYNQLAPRFKNLILFYRLKKSDLVYLYNSADLYITCATSVFETYGKSQLEAISCGIPVLAPNWDGFKYYIDESTGALADVHFTEQPIENPFQFAVVSKTNFVDKLHENINRDRVDNNLNDWAYYDSTLSRISELIVSIIDNKSTHCKPTFTNLPSTLPKPINKFIENYLSFEAPTLERKLSTNGIISGLSQVG